MALFTDGAISTVDDLLGYESSVLETARTEGIDLTMKLALAADELGIELTTFLVQQGGPPPGLESVVVTEALHKWHTFQALALTYRDAYHAQLNDRHLNKWKEWERQAKWASAMLFESGVGIVDDPVAKADPPELSSVAGALPAATYFVRVAWVSAAGEEGCPSELGILTAGDGQLLRAEAVNPPAEPQSWNVYAGFSQTDTTLQNDSPIGAGQAWTSPDTGIRRGRPAGTGQTPDYYLQRGGRRRVTGEESVPGVLLRG